MNYYVVSVIDREGQAWLVNVAGAADRAEALRRAQEAVPDAQQVGEPQGVVYG